MPAKVVEKHILTGTPEVQVDIWDNGTVEVIIGEEVVQATRLAEIVAFVENHGQVTVTDGDSRSLWDAVSMARRFHELYEEIAPSCGYETRPETRKEWDDLPRENRFLMIAVCTQILSELAADLRQVVREWTLAQGLYDAGWER